MSLATEILITNKYHMNENTFTPEKPGEVSKILYSLVRLPNKIDQVLYMIGEDLKSQKFFNTMNALDWSDNFYQPRLAVLILKHMNLDDGSDEIVNFYYALVEKHSKKVEADNNSLMKQVMKVYAKLVMEKEKRKK